MKEHEPLFKEIGRRLGQARRVLLITHKNPDGDALGSMLGLAYYLHENNLDHISFCASEVPEHFFFLPRFETIKANVDAITRDEFDTLVVLDAGDLERTGVIELLPQIKGVSAIINIDHHRTNTNFGHINLVEPKASSTAEIIYHFLDFHRFAIRPDVATCLLTGILTDTGSFSNLATTPSSLAVASKLLAAGARSRDIMDYTLHNKSLNQLQLWGRALARLKKNEATGFVTTIITKKDMDELGLDDESIDGIANFLNSLKEASVVMVLREKEEGVVKASLRTHEPNIDVSQFARQFGGGGHKKAAGFSIKGKIVETDKGWKIE